MTEDKTKYEILKEAYSAQEKHYREYKKQCEVILSKCQNTLIAQLQCPTTSIQRLRIDTSTFVKKEAYEPAGELKYLPFEVMCTDGTLISAFELYLNPENRTPRRGIIYPVHVHLKESMAYLDVANISAKVSIENPDQGIDELVARFIEWMKTYWDAYRFPNIPENKPQLGFKTVDT